jgi:heterotetrameric sarcosine oxidase gamma subunit
MPADRSAAFNGPVTVVSVGRGNYLLVKKREPGDQALTRFADRGDGQYSLVDCSDQFVFLVLEGPLSPRVLGALCSIDFDPGSFREGSASVARLHDVRAYIWRGPGQYRYTIGVQRSLALHVWQELLDACMAHSVDP